MVEFGRVITAMVTPFDDGLNVDYARAESLARRLIEDGSDAIVVAGTTGESPTLSDEEKVRLFQAVKEAVGEKAKVIAGTGTYDTRHSIHLSKQAEKAGVDGLLLVVPYYNKPSQEGLYRHFRAIAEETQLPIILYNIPGRTGVNMLPETVARLAEVRNIVGIKEASGNLDQVSEVRRRTPRDFLIYSGDDSLTLPILAVGGMGVISVASHLVGNQIQEMIQSFFRGDIRRALDLHIRLLPLFKAMFVTTNPSPVKAALAMAGFPVGGLRPPLVEVTEQEKAVIANALRELALVGVQ